MCRILLLILLLSVSVVSCTLDEDHNESIKDVVKNRNITISASGLTRGEGYADTSLPDSVHFYLFKMNNDGKDAVLTKYGKLDLNDNNNLVFEDLMEDDYILVGNACKPINRNSDYTSFVRKEGIDKYTFSEYSNTKYNFPKFINSNQQMSYYDYNNECKFKLKSDTVVSINLARRTTFISVEMNYDLNNNVINKNASYDYFVCNTPKQFYLSHNILKDGKLIPRPIEINKNSNSFFPIEEKDPIHIPNSRNSNDLTDIIKLYLLENIVTEATKNFATFLVVRVKLTPLKAMINGVYTDAPATPPSGGYFLAIDNTGKPELTSDGQNYLFRDQSSLLGGSKIISYKEGYLYYKLQLTDENITQINGVTPHPWSIISGRQYFIDINRINLQVPPAPTFAEAVKGFPYTSSQWETPILLYKVYNYTSDYNIFY